MTKELELYNEFLNIIDVPVKSHLLNFNDAQTLERYRVLRTQIENEIIEKETNDFELEVFKLAYEWKCNGVEGTYEEVLDQARKTVEGWKEIERKDYGENYKNVIEEHTLYSIVPQEKCIVVTFEHTKFYWKDYGKTWALTKEELINEKED